MRMQKTYPVTDLTPHLSSLVGRLLIHQFDRTSYTTNARIN